VARRGDSAKSVGGSQSDAALMAHIRRMFEEDCAV
jgi:hypothetical protein